MERLEQEYFRHLLEFTNQDKSRAMDLSGLSRAQFYKILKRVEQAL
jgi:transcriptional regulator with AAA-type ATPase domain